MNSYQRNTQLRGPGPRVVDWGIVDDVELHRGTRSVKEESVETAEEEVKVIAEDRRRLSSDGDRRPPSNTLLNPSSGAPLDLGELAVNLIQKCSSDSLIEVLGVLSYLRSRGRSHWESVNIRCLQNGYIDKRIIELCVRKIEGLKYRRKRQLIIVAIHVLSNVVSLSMASSRNSLNCRHSGNVEIETRTILDLGAVAKSSW
jgi:hypothetical protein